MAMFHLTDPSSGAEFEIDAPDEHAAVNALGALGKAEPAPAAPAAEPKGALQSIREALHGGTRALENGILFGLGDRYRALTGAAIGDGSYGGNLKNEQSDTAQFAKDHPIASPVIESVGGIAAPIGALAAASKAATLGGKIAAGAGAGGAIGAGQGAASSKDWTDVGQVARDAGGGALVGGAIGGALPVVSAGAGKAIGSIANLLRGNVDGMSRAASGQLISAMEADGPAAVRSRVAALGDDAMLADAGPTFQGRTQGVALNSDEARSITQNTLTTRNEGTNARIMGDVNAALGPAEDPQSVTNAIRAHRAEVDSKAYPAALDNAPPVKIAPVMYHLADAIEQAPTGSMERKALTNLQGMLTKTKKEPLLDSENFPQYDRLGNERWKNVEESHSDANILHKVKQEIDNVISYDAPGLGVPAGALSRQQGALKQMRSALNDTLELQVPGYKEANAASAALAKRGEAVEAGTQYLGSGKTVASPDRFAGEFSQLTPGEQIAFAKGSRGNIERVLGTKANDLQALRGELQGEGGWNTAKIATVHGAPAADELAGSVNRNLAFRDTYSKVTQNSQTAQRTAAANAMKPLPPGEVPMINPNMTVVGLIGTALKKAAQGAANGLRSDPTRSYGEVARALTEQGPKRDARIQSIVDALERRQGNSVAAARGGDATALLAAIAAGAAIRKKNRDR